MHPTGKSGEEGSDFCLEIHSGYLILTVLQVAEYKVIHHKDSFSKLLLSV